MITQLLEDRRQRPDLFHFFGSISPARLSKWLKDQRLVIPEDLRAFWCETGGGDMFETETILGPFGRADLGDDIESVNQFHKQRGMPADWLILHTGIGNLTVVKMSSGEYASVQEGSYEVLQNFVSLADWYGRLIRGEYAARYGLQSE